MQAATQREATQEQGQVEQTEFYFSSKTLKCTYNSRGGLCRLEAESRDEKDECTKVKVREAFELRLEKRQAIIGKLTNIIDVTGLRVCGTFPVNQLDVVLRLVFLQACLQVSPEVEWAWLAVSRWRHVWGLQLVMTVLNVVDDAIAEAEKCTSTLCLRF